MICCEEYGKALYMLADEDKITDPVLNQLEVIGSVLSENPEYIKLLDTPAVPNDEKIGLIDNAFCGAETILLNFVKILCEKRAVYQLAKCIDAYKKMYDDANGIIRATAVTAVPMSERQLEALKNKLDLITGKNVVLENRVDRSVIGGVSVRMTDIQLDGSIKNKLESFRESLGETVI